MKPNAQCFFLAIMACAQARELTMGAWCALDQHEQRPVKNWRCCCRHQTNSRRLPCPQKVCSMLRERLCIILGSRQLLGTKALSGCRGLSAGSPHYVVILWICALPNPQESDL